VKILEREAEVARLLAAVAAAEEGRGALLLVAGEAGIGKTTLRRSASWDRPAQGHAGPSTVS
jgi:predicted ATPase